MRTSKHLYRASVHVFVTACGFFNNSSCSCNTTTSTKVGYDDSYLLLRTDFATVIFSHRNGSHGKAFDDSF